MAGVPTEGINVVDHVPPTGGEMRREGMNELKTQVEELRQHIRRMTVFL